MSAALAVLPSNIEAEQALLGALLVNADAYPLVSSFLRPHHFSEPIHQRLFEAVAEVQAAGAAPTAILLRNALPADINIAGMSGSQYIAHLAVNAATIVNAPDYARAILDAAVRRRLLGAAHRISEAARLPTSGVPSSELVALAEQEIAGAREEVAGRDESWCTVGEAAAQLVANLEAKRAGNDETVVSTGFADLDRRIGGGYRAKRLYVIAGRPGMGKTVFGVASARRVARKGYGALLFSLEIDREEIAARLIASDMASSDVRPTYSDILSERIDDRHRSAVWRTAETVKKLPIGIEAGRLFSMAEIDGKAALAAERMKRKGIPLRLVVIDYLGLIAVTDRYRGRKVDELGEVALAAKSLAKRLGVAVVLLAQLNRGVEGRDDKRPVMSDLRDSGNIEEHADVVGLLYREAYYLAKEAKKGDAEATERLLACQYDLDLDLGKNRLGPTDAVRLWADVARSEIDDMAWGR